MRPCKLWRFTVASLLGGLLWMQIPQSALAFGSGLVRLESIREEGARVEVIAWADRDAVACRVLVTYRRQAGAASIAIPAVARAGANRWTVVLPDRAAGAIEVQIIVDDGTPF